MTVTKSSHIMSACAHTHTHIHTLTEQNYFGPRTKSLRVAMGQSALGRERERMGWGDHHGVGLQT